MNFVISTFQTEVKLMQNFEAVFLSFRSSNQETKDYLDVNTKTSGFSLIFSNSVILTFETGVK